MSKKKKRSDWPGPRLTGAIDWDEKTDQECESEMSSITNLTDDEIRELFPEPADIKNFAKLMKVLKSADDRNTKINYFISNAEEFSGIVITLLEKFV